MNNPRITWQDVILALGHLPVDNINTEVSDGVVGELRELFESLELDPTAFIKPNGLQN